jgi:hypothetical protein
MNNMGVVASVEGRKERTVRLEHSPLVLISSLYLFGRISCYRVCSGKSNPQFNSRNLEYPRPCGYPLSARRRVTNSSIHTGFGTAMTLCSTIVVDERISGSCMLLPYNSPYAVSGRFLCGQATRVIRVYYLWYYCGLDAQSHARDLARLPFVRSRRLPKHNEMLGLSTFLTLLR